MYGLIDGNNFFVSCERVFDPKLEGKPVAVLSNNDGCCVSRSNEFKALKIPMGTPYFQLKPMIAEYGLILKSSNYELYGDLSRRVIAVLGTFSQDVEQYSIDEAFIGVSMTDPDELFEFGRKVRATILKWVGIPCGVGFAPSKTLAKIANHIGKKEPAGVFVMPSDPSPILDSLPVSEVWGVGRKLAPKLQRIGIRTAGQLAAADEKFLLERFPVTLARTARELRGESVIGPEDPEKLSGSITCSRSFGRPVVDFEELTQSVSSYTAQAAEKLRREDQTAAGVNVYFIYYPEYAPDPLPGGWSSTTVTFDSPTASTGAMISQILPRLRKIFIPGRRYKKSGVMFFGLEPASNLQPDLFADPAEREKERRLSAALDGINRRFGRGTVFHLAEGLKKPWAMRRELLTPCCTTRWDELPLVK